MKYNKVLKIVGAIIFTIGGILMLISGLYSLPSIGAIGIIFLSLGSLTLAVSSLPSPKA